MVFNSWSFFPFFLATLAAYYTVRQFRHKKVILLLSSYVFYAFFHAPYVLILMVSTVIDYYLGRKIFTSLGGKRKVYLYLSLVSNLGMLAYFKYASFFLENFITLLEEFGLYYDPIAWSIILPVGISYYTFQTLSYSIDIYRGDLEPSDSILDFAFFVAFFPQLVAGPIVRASQFLPQAKEEIRGAFNKDKFVWGLYLLTIGLFGKIVIADTIAAPIVDAVYGSAKSASFLDAWVGTIAFSCQIFFDFSGYSLAAIGVAMCYGFSLPDNFRYPYAAAGFSDFWRRWHISLSSWLRDYLYISLGGNRRGEFRTYTNLFITMLLGGLWHGAAWTFIVWGALHGIFLIGERLLDSVITRISSIFGQGALIFGVLTTYILVCFTWVPFRAGSIHDAYVIGSTMLSPSIPDSIPSNYIVLLGTMTIILVYQFCARDSNLESVFSKVPKWIRVFLIGFALFLIFASRGEQRAFIYFQF